MAVCPSCGRQNPEGFRFCGFCTASLDQAAPPAAEERKVISVLFCDLVGFTASSDEADPEDVRARMRPYHARLRHEIERYGGTVEKFVGDAVMAVFGAPVAHEDDAERAVRAGLRILEAMDDLNERDAALGLRVRIGINTGEAVVALGVSPEHGGGIVADVVNTAARLQSAAPVGGIVVGELTVRATKEVFEYEALEPVSVKGKAEPVPLWRARAARGRFGTDIIRAHAAPMVGRELEQTLLQGTYERAVRDASVQLVTLVGEPGIGKSRLVAELLKFVDARPELVRWRQGRCLPYGEGITFWALGEIIKAEAGILESDSPEQAARKLDVAVPADAQDREWLKARLGPLVGVDLGPAQREESFTAWRRFLESLAAKGPAVLVFEDLHWADRALLAFLEHLADWSEGVPLLLICTARPELYDRQANWAGGKRNAATIHLAPLSDEETARLVSALLDAAVLPPEVQALILERAGGNPLYAEEFVRMLKDRGLLVRHGRRLRLWEGADIPFPETIKALIAARLDTLSPHRKALLQDAAVIGKVFWAGALATIGKRDEVSVREALHELSRNELVRPARSSSMEGEAEYSFWHLLVREVCYAQIPRAARARKHQAAAEWIEQQSPERVEDLAEVLAHHYTEALELARAAGQPGEAAELEAQARRFLDLAGERALALDIAKAEAHYARALALAPAGHPDRPGILARWADAARQAGRPVAAASALEEAIATFRERGEALAAGRALTMLAAVLRHTGHTRSEQAITEALALLESEPPGPELVEAYAQMAGLKSVEWANREAVAWAERALALAAELGLEEPARALGFRGAAHCDLGDAAGLEEMRRALALATERGRGRDAAVLHNNLAEALLPIQGPSVALEAYRAGIDFAERHGIGEHALWIAGSSLTPLIARGEWDEALRLAGTLAEQAQASGATFTLLEARWSEARVRLERGEELAAAHVDWLETAARETGEAQFIAPAFAVVALARLARGRPKLAAALLDELQRLPHVRETTLFLFYLPDLVRAALACGRIALAQWFADGIEPIFPLHEHTLCAARAALAKAHGEHAEAADLYAEAAGRWQAFGNVPERGQALLGQGRCLLALGSPRSASPLREARGIFAGLGARPLLAEADALLKRALALSS
jgi:class 3 adenylate cyclase/tetratricopeptide (TPR) repeat protein